MDIAAVTPKPSAALQPYGVCAIAGSKLEWARRALHRKKNIGSVMETFMKVAEHANELTPGSEQISTNAARALLAPIPLPSLMDEEDAKYCLEYVADKVVTRAAKRKAEAAAAKAAEEARKMANGQAWAAKKAAIAARPPGCRISCQVGQHTQPPPHSGLG